MELLELETEALRARRTACYTAMDEVQKELQEAYVVQNTAKMNVIRHPNGSRRHCRQPSRQRMRRRN